MIIYYAHGGSDNHGCEAIIKGTNENIERKSLVLSGNMKADQKYGLNEICKIQPDSYKRYFHPFRWFIYRVLNKIIKYNTVFMLVNGLEEGIYLSVGGDNYCYPGLIEPLLTANEKIRNKNNKIVLWGTSIEPEVLKNEIIFEDISKYDLIFARESITYEALVKYGLKDKVYLYPDPAFAMKVKKIKLPDNVFDSPVVGLNISPLILRYADGENTVKEGYIEIIKYILENTDYNIALFPHVVKRNNNDFDAIYQLAKIIQSKRVFIINDNSADSLKYLISKCSFFVGARTHSTIAAYSTCVPTMVIGYSVKARGIAKDIFGTAKDYVIDVRLIKDKKIMIDNFVNLFSRREEIKEYLDGFMPEYSKRTVEAGNMLSMYIDKWHIREGE